MPVLEPTDVTILLTDPEACDAFPWRGSLAEFLAANEIRDEDLDPDGWGRLARLAVGEQLTLGGGAAAEFTVERLA